MVMKPIFVIVLLLLTVVEAKAQSRETLVRSKDWFGFKYTEGDNYSCYMTTEPIAKQGKHNNRGYVNAYVTHRPLYGEYDEKIHRQEDNASMACSSLCMFLQRNLLSVN